MKMRPMKMRRGTVWTMQMRLVAVPCWRMRVGPMRVQAAPAAIKTVGTERACVVFGPGTAVVAIPIARMFARIGASAPGCVCMRLVLMRSVRMGETEEFALGHIGTGRGRDHDKAHGYEHQPGGLHPRAQPCNHGNKTRTTTRTTKILGPYLYQVRTCEPPGFSLKAGTVNSSLLGIQIQLLRRRAHARRNSR